MVVTVTLVMMADVARPVVEVAMMTTVVVMSVMVVVMVVVACMVMVMAAVVFVVVVAVMVVLVVTCVVVVVVGDCYCSCCAYCGSCCDGGQNCCGCYRGWWLLCLTWCVCIGCGYGEEGGWGIPMTVMVGVIIVTQHQPSQGP